MNKDDYLTIQSDVSSLRREITKVNDNLISFSNVTSYSISNLNELEERISNLEKKINEIYPILFNAKILNLSNLDN